MVFDNNSIIDKTNNMEVDYVIKRILKSEEMEFDKILRRIKKLSDGLKVNHRSNTKVCSMIYPDYNT